MATKLNKELNSIQKEIKDKTKVVNKLNTKTFSSFVVDEIKKKNLWQNFLWKIILIN